MTVRLEFSDWDNHFGAYMLSLDAKDLGYSALIQVVKSKTAEGFVPNSTFPALMRRVSTTLCLQMTDARMKSCLIRLSATSWMVQLLRPSTKRDTLNHQWAVRFCSRCTKSTMTNGLWSCFSMTCERF